MGVRLASFALVALVGCHGLFGHEAMPPDTVSLRVTGSPSSATVYVDDEPVGQLDFLANRGIALPPGSHRVTVQAPGYFPLDREVVAKGPTYVGETVPPIKLAVALTPIPD